MNKENIFISTIASDAEVVARSYELGLEIAEYCTAWNMDSKFKETDAVVSKKLAGISGRIFHAPFNELFPVPLIRKQENWRLIVIGRQSHLQKTTVHSKL